MEQREVIVAHLRGGLTFDQIAGVAALGQFYSPPLSCGLDGPERTPGGAMSNEPDSPEPELNAVAAATRLPRPARSHIALDLLMFQAAQASAGSLRTGIRVWIGIAASLAGWLLIGEGVLRAHWPPAQIVKEVIVIREPRSAPAPAAVAGGSAHRDPCGGGHGVAVERKNSPR